MTEVAPFKAGDKAFVNGIPATIVNFDEATGVFVYEHTIGGGTNTVYNAHVSNHTVVLIEPEVPVAEPVVDAEASESEQGK